MLFQPSRAFPTLQDARHVVDYDPGIRFLPLDTSFFINAAKIAINDLDQIPPDEKADIPALMLVGARR